MKLPLIKSFIHILFIVCISILTLNGQYVNEPSKVPEPYSVGFLSANAAYGIPIGNYVTNGYAQPGVNYCLTAASTVDDSVLGFMAKVNYGQNGVDGFALASSLDNLQYKFFPHTMGPYSYTTVMIGPNIFIRSIHKLGFSFRLLGGLMYASSPVVTLIVYDNTGNEYLVGTQKLVSNGFCYETGFGANYLLAKYLCVFMDADLMHASPIAEGETYGENTTGAQIVNHLFGSPEMPHTVLTIQVGIGFKLKGLHMYTSN